MSQRFDLSGIAGNDLAFNLALTSAGVPLNLSGLTLTAYLKVSAVTPDATATVFTVSSGLTVTDTAGGLVTWAIPHADVPATDGPGALWYRVDVTSTGVTQTAMYGALNLTAA